LSAINNLLHPLQGLSGQSQHIIDITGTVANDKKS